MAEPGGGGLDPGTQAKLAAGAGGGDKEGWDGMVSAAISLANLFKWIPMKLNGVFETAVTTGVDLNKAGIDSSKPLPSVLGSIELNGGNSAFSKMIAALMKKPDFSGVGAPQSVSMADLGGFTPDFTPRNFEAPSVGPSLVT